MRIFLSMLLLLFFAVFASAEGRKEPIHVWTTSPLAHPFSRVLEQLVDQHNQLNSEYEAILVFVNGQAFPQRFSRRSEDALAPDLIVAPHHLLLPLTEKNALKPLQDHLENAKLFPEEMLPWAWDQLRQTNQLWGLPICADTQLLYINLDLLESSGKSLDQLQQEKGILSNWEFFLNGKGLQCIASSDYLLNLLSGQNQAPGKIALHTRFGERFIAREALRVWAVAVPDTSAPALVKLYPLFRAAQSPAMTVFSWRQGTKLPLAPESDAFKELRQQIPVRGPWLEDF